MEIPADRSEAERRSYGCPECGGAGNTVRFVEHEVPAARGMGWDGEVIVREDTLNCYCHRCLAGRWMERCHRDNFPRIRAAFIDLADPAYEALQDPDLKHRRAFREHLATVPDRPRTVREMLDGLKLSPRRGEPVY